MSIHLSKRQESLLQAEYKRQYDQAQATQKMNQSKGCAVEKYLHVNCPDLRVYFDNGHIVGTTYGSIDLGHDETQLIREPVECNKSHCYHGNNNDLYDYVFNHKDKPFYVTFQKTGDGCCSGCTVHVFDMKNHKKVDLSAPFE